MTMVTSNRRINDHTGKGNSGAVLMPYKGALGVISNDGNLIVQIEIKERAVEVTVVAKSQERYYTNKTSKMIIRTVEVATKRTGLYKAS